ncbi:MAG TPA: LysE family translocator, partial [Tianweitania sediminis]|nr:LysE family translocator [Tianweitania sediminis]
QFLDTSRPVYQQMVIFELTFLFLATVNAALYGFLASTARRSIRKPSIQRVVNRVGGSLMIGAGALAVGWRRAAT